MNVLIFAPILLLLPLARAFALWRVGSRGGDLETVRHYYADRFVRAAMIWGAMVHLSVTSLAMEALSCVPVRGVDGKTVYFMVTHSDEVCYKSSQHIILCVLSTIILLGFSVGFPASVMARIHNNPTKVYDDSRFVERYNYFYEFYAVGHTKFWSTDFLASCVVASGKSFLYPHSIYQMSVSVAVFGHKVVYIIARRPYIDWITDVIQGVLAVVSLIAVNMNFFERQGLLRKVPSVTTGLAIALVIIFGVTIVITLSIVAVLLVKGPRPEPDRSQAKPAGDEAVKDHAAVGEEEQIALATAATAAAAAAAATAEGTEAKPATAEDDGWLGIGGFIPAAVKDLWGGGEAAPPPQAPEGGTMEGVEIIKAPGMFDWVWEMFGGASAVPEPAAIPPPEAPAAPEGQTAQEVAPAAPGS